jgi:uncharacterized membrane protein
MDTIQRAIGGAIGAIVTIALLVLMTDITLEDALIPVVIGVVAAWAWPIVIAFWLGRRAKQRRDGKIEDEVERQVNEQTRG